MQPDHSRPPTIGSLFHFLHFHERRRHHHNLSSSASLPPFVDLAILLPNTPRPRERATPTQARSRCQTFQLSLLMSQLDQPSLSSTLPTHLLPSRSQNELSTSGLCPVASELPCLMSAHWLVVVVPPACLPAILSAPPTRGSGSDCLAHFCSATSRLVCSLFDTYR